MTSTDEYVCTLDEKSLKKAKEELNEDPKNRLGAVETFRKWILEQPHIKCPTGLFRLLAFGMSNSPSVCECDMLVSIFAFSLQRWILCQTL